MQDEEVNPMAPSSQDTGRSTSRKGRATSNGAEIGASLAHAQPVPLPPPLQPEFALAAPSQQFGFRLSGSESQTEKDTQALRCARFPGVPSLSLSNHGSSLPQTGSGTQAPTRTRFSASQSSSQGSVPSSHSPSLFLGGSSGGTSTAPTSCAPSICSLDGRRLVQSFHHTSWPHSSASSNSTFASSHPMASSQTHTTDNREHNTAPARLQWTASFYSLPFHINRTGHSLSATPDIYNTRDIQLNHEVRHLSNMRRFIDLFILRSMRSSQARMTALQRKCFIKVCPWYVRRT